MKRKQFMYFACRIAFLILALHLLLACSTTEKLPDEEVLYTGIGEISYTTPTKPVRKMGSDSSGVILSIADAAERVDAILKGNSGNEAGMTSEQIQRGGDRRVLTKEERAARKERKRLDALALETARTEVNGICAQQLTLRICLPSYTFSNRFVGI